jgi:hypothetical protein
MNEFWYPQGITHQHVACHVYTIYDLRGVTSVRSRRSTEASCAGREQSGLQRGDAGDGGGAGRRCDATSYRPLRHGRGDKKHEGSERAANTVEHEPLKLVLMKKRRGASAEDIINVWRATTPSNGKDTEDRWREGGHVGRENSRNRGRSWKLKLTLW